MPPFVGVTHYNMLAAAKNKYYTQNCIFMLTKTNGLTLTMTDIYVKLCLALF